MRAAPNVSQDVMNNWLDSIVWNVDKPDPPQGPPGPVAPAANGTKGVFNEALHPRAEDGEFGEVGHEVEKIDTDDIGGHKNRSRLSAPKVEARLVGFYNRNPTAAKDAKWYKDAHDLIGKTAAKIDVDPGVLAGVVAATSPRMPWDTANGRTPNLSAAVQVMQYHKDNPNVDPEAFAKSLQHPGMLRDSLTNGLRIAQGEKPSAVLKSPKISSFYNNLEFPGETDSVTVDTWMARAISGAKTNDDYDKAGGQIIGSNGYQWAADRIRSGASQVGLSPDAFQSVVWSQIRREL
jgi:hypothetical protein